MSLKVNETVMQLCYELLRATDPKFVGRKLPPASEVKFRVIKAKTHYGDCDGEVIRVSSAKHAHLASLLATIGHEMAHMLDFAEGGDGSHGKRFQKFARRISRVNGFDEKAI